MGMPRFNKRIIGEVKNDVPPGEMNTFSIAGDVNGDGRVDYVISGRNGRMVWLENRGQGEWKEHFIDEVEMMECGGCLYDLTGNGYLDVINGGDWRAGEIWWWENPGEANGKWIKRTIVHTGITQFHDTLIGDIKNNGQMYLMFTNQKGKDGTALYCIPLPKDPRVSPWPGLEIIGEGKAEPILPYKWNTRGLQPEEGLAVGDIDGDGKNEVVCGTHWYKYTGEGWECHKYAKGYITTKCVIGDVDGDGSNEIVLSEGDPCVYNKTQGGKLAWFKPKDDITEMWDEHVIEDFLLDAHTLQLGDICGNGHIDILCGEVGVTGENREYIRRPPAIMIFENDGKGNFTKHVIDQGTGIHEGQLVDLENRGVLDMIGKPLHGNERWNVVVWYNSRD